MHDEETLICERGGEEDRVCRSIRRSASLPHYVEDARGVVVRTYFQVEIDDNPRCTRWAQRE